MDGSPPSSPAPQSAFQRAFNRSNFSISNLLTIWSQHICNFHGTLHMIITFIFHILSRYLNQIFIIFSLRVELCHWWECRGWRYYQHHHYQHHLLPSSQKSSRTSSPSSWSLSWSPGMGSSADSWESGSEPEVGNRIPVTRITKITMMKTNMKTKMKTKMMMLQLVRE